MKERPILFSGQMVKAILDGKKTQTRRVITKQNSETSAPWDRLEWDESKWPADLGFGFLADGTGFGKLGYLHVPTRPHVDDRQDDADDWTRNRVYPIWDIGDRLYVRETTAPIPESKPAGYHTDPKWKDRKYWYAADNDKPTWGGKWTPSILMPREASRITLEVTDVRVERLQEITEEDAIAEGFEVKLRSQDFDPALAGFYELWEKLNAERGKCKTCKGHGVVSAWAGSVSGNSLMQTAEDCPDCKGYETGYGWDANPWVFVVSFKRI